MSLWPGGSGSRINRILSESVSYARYRLANNVSPPEGTGYLFGVEDRTHRRALQGRLYPYARPRQNLAYPLVPFGLR